MSTTCCTPPSLIDFISIDARLILTIGAENGAIISEYERKNPIAKFLQIAPDVRDHKFSYAQLDSLNLSDGALDCIIFDRVLDLLSDPWEGFRECLGYLSDRGTILIRIENPEHWMKVDGGLRGQWGRRTDKITPNKTLETFTFESLPYKLRQFGLASTEFFSEGANSPAAEEFIEAMSPSLRLLGIDEGAYHDRVAPERFICRAERHKVRTKLQIVSTMLNPVGGVSHVRVRQPMQALSTDRSLATVVIGGSDPPPTDAGDPGVFIFHRPLIAGEDGLKRVQSLVTLGWVVVCEFDDHPDYIPILQRPDVFNFNAVHAVQTSTEPLANVLRAHNPEIAVFPNSIYRMPDVKNYTCGGPITLLFAGLNRECDWPPYIAALNSVISRFGNRLHFQIINDRGLYDMLDTPHKKFTPLCSYETYNDLLARCEISFMPLLDTPFNRCKSDLKFIEAAAHRVTALASDVVYEDSIKDGQTGILFRTAAELEMHLTRLVANPEIGRIIGDCAREYIKSDRMLAYQTSLRANWYKSLWERRTDLNRSLFARVPQLAESIN